MVYGDFVEERHICFEDLDGKALHDNSWDDDFPADPVEAFVEVRTASSVL